MNLWEIPQKYTMEAMQSLRNKKSELILQAIEDWEGRHPRMPYKVTESFEDGGGHLILINGDPLIWFSRANIARTESERDSYKMFLGFEYKRFNVVAYY